MSSPPPTALRALLLDAGNTLVFLDFDAVAEIARGERVDVQPEDLRKSEGAAKRRYEERLQAGASHEDGWDLYMQTLLEAAGVECELASRVVGPLRASHERHNLWRRVPDDLIDALDRASSGGLRLGVVSNSEGRLEALFQQVGLAGRFEVVVDSALEGVRKPDPEIFRRALGRMKLEASQTLYAGDIPAIDVGGARGAGLAAALIDPLDFYPHHEGPRFSSVAALVEWLL